MYRVVGQDTAPLAQAAQRREPAWMRENDPFSLFFGQQAQRQQAPAPAAQRQQAPAAAAAQRQQAPAAAAAQRQQAAAQQQSAETPVDYTPWIVGGAALLGVVGLVAALSSRPRVKQQVRVQQVRVQPQRKSVRKKSSRRRRR